MAHQLELGFDAYHVPVCVTLSPLMLTILFSLFLDPLSRRRVTLLQRSSEPIQVSRFSALPRQRAIHRKLLSSFAA